MYSSFAGLLINTQIIIATQTFDYDQTPSIAWMNITRTTME